MALATLHPNDRLISSSDEEDGVTAQSLVASSGFLSTLASYLTSRPKKTKSAPKKVIQKQKLISNWDDFDLIKLNEIIRNYLYHDCSRQNLLVEIENLVGKPREVCFYAVLSVFSCILMLHDPIGTITAFMTLIIPSFYTCLALIHSESESLEMQNNKKSFVLRYWLIYSVFLTAEAFVSTLIKFDLRLARLLFLSACLTPKVPILSLASSLVHLKFLKLLQVFEDNNWHMVETTQGEIDQSQKIKITRN